MNKEEYVASPILVYQKKADKTANKIIIPKSVINRMGRDFAMEVYKDKLVLIPIPKTNGEEYETNGY